MYNSLCALTSCCGRLCALWECPHVSSDGGDLDHILPLLSPRVLVHLVPGLEHGAVRLLLHVLALDWHWTGTGLALDWHWTGTGLALDWHWALDTGTGHGP
jgi:hypothetical protein